MIYMILICSLQFNSFLNNNNFESYLQAIGFTKLTTFPEKWREQFVNSCFFVLFLTRLDVDAEIVCFFSGSTLTEIGCILNG